MKKNKWIALLLFLTLPFFLGGCRSFLVPQDKPLALNNTLLQQKNPQSKMEILSFENIGTGTVQDISYDGSTLLLLNTTEAPPITYNINLLRVSENENQLTSFVNSEKHQLSAKFDEYAKGVFYVEKGMDTGNEKSSNQLIWTSIDKSVTKTISSPEENVNSNICIVDDSSVIYSNSNNQIVMATSEGDRRIYHTVRSIPVHDIQYYPKNNAVIFTGTDPTDDQKTNLYLSEIKDGSDELSSTLIDENVINFDINRQNGSIIYTQNYGDSNRIMSYSISKGAQPSVVSEGNFTSAAYTPNGEKILYTQFSSINTKTSQSIWIMDANGKNKLQISAPLTLTSAIIAHPYKSTIYFSIEKKRETATSDTKGQPISQIYKIDYNIN